MSTRKIFNCIVDDTALITNISEIEGWTLSGAITLVIPLHTLERLHLLKKDASQIGANARKAVKFLDRITSGKEDFSVDPVVLQGPDEQYLTWSEVEIHYSENQKVASANTETVADARETEVKPMQTTQDASSQVGNASGALSQILLNKLNFSKEPGISSPTSTPPLSPNSSGPQSSKTSPEVKSATMISHDASPVPPSLKSLVNSVVWYMYEKHKSAETSDMIFLTNSADTATIVRDFGINPKTIHQLRKSIGAEELGLTNHGEHQKKHTSPPPAVTPAETEPKPLFKYEEEESDEEEVIFKPRGPGSVRGTDSLRGTPTASVRGRNSRMRSPRLSFSLPTLNAASKPQVPTEEIDPDSFDRGSFGRGSTPLVPTGPHRAGHANGIPRGASPRGGFASATATRNSPQFRGVSRGIDRGSGRGRGRLFVP